MEVKPGYKQTEVGVIPNDWDVKPLGIIGDVKMCRRIFKHQTREVGDVPFYKIGTFGNVPDAFIPQELFDEYKSKYSFPKKGDVLISAAGTIGRTVIYNGEPAYFQDSNIVWIDNDQTKATNEYLWHYYKITRWSISDGGTVARLYNDNIKKKIYIALPPIPEQRAIAGALSDVDALLGALDQLIAKKYDLKQAAIQQLLTGQTHLPGFHGQWEVKRLGDIGKFKNGLNKDSGAFGHGSSFVNLMDVFGVNAISSTNHLGLVASTKVDRDVYDLRRGDVLFIRSSVKPSGVGLTAVVECDLAETVYSGFLIRFRDGGLLDIGFKKHCFYDESFRKKVIAASSVSANTNINQNALRLLSILLPPTKAEQTAIAGVLSDMDAELAALEQRRAKTRALKQGMMQELLTGRTRLV
jgi:type I restriction enzyme S subunit